MDSCSRIAWENFFQIFSAHYTNMARISLLSFVFLSKNVDAENQSAVVAREV
jgi:hypothetical protein